MSTKTAKSTTSKTTSAKSPRARTGPTPPLSDPRPSKQVWGPLPPPPPPSAEQVAVQAEQAARQRKAEEDEAEARRKRSTLELRRPWRYETPAQEQARYLERLAAWEQKKAIAEGRKGHETEDAEHVVACTSRGCDHPGHVRPRRELHSKVPKDLGHLGDCEKEDPECLHPSHLLPPRPLDAAVEFCCESKCYPRFNARSWTECVQLPVWLRERRQAEVAANPKLLKGRYHSSGGGASVLVTRHLSEETSWGFHHAVKDEAMMPLREEE